MLTGGMYLEYFCWVTAHSNKSSQLCSVAGKFGGIKWKNITVQEMVRLYLVMICTSIEPRHLGGYKDYFKPTLCVRVGLGYNVKFVRYGGWTESIMTLARFHQIISASNPEDGESAVVEKCH